MPADRKKTKLEEYEELVREHSSQTVNHAGNIPLIFATYHGQMGVCEELILRGDDVNIVDQFGWTALFYACNGGHYDICNLLLTNGANVNHADKLLIRPLMQASARGFYEICLLLVNFGANVNCACSAGLTPLMYSLKHSWTSIFPRMNVNAVISTYKRIALLLLSRGAKLTVLDASGKSPLDYVVSSADQREYIREANWYRRKEFATFLHTSNMFPKKKKDIATPEDKKEKGSSHAALASPKLSYHHVVLSNIDICREIVGYL